MLSRLLLGAVLALLLACTAARADDIKVHDPDVTVLTDSNFHSFIQQDLALVEFYAPWCGHCKNLAPEYAEAATLLKGSGVVLGKMDATVHQGHGQEVRGYPTLKIFRNGKASDYNGPRKAEGIVAYMKKQVGPAAKPVTSEADLKALQQQDPAVQYAVVAFFAEGGKPSQLQSSFSILANRMRDEFAFGRCTDAALAASEGVPAGSESLVAYLRGEKSVYCGSSKTSEVESWIREHSLPQVGEYNEATAGLYAARGLPLVKLFLPVDRKGHTSKTMTYYSNRLRKIAERFPRQVLVAYADKAAESSQKAAYEALNFSEEEQASGNTLVIESLKDAKQYKFDMEEYEEEEEEEEAAEKKSSSSKKSSSKKKKGLDVEGWLAFVEDYLAGDVPAYVRSQKAPKNNLSLPVKIVTGANFDELVTEGGEDRDVFLEFYAPWCGHCKALEPKLEELGQTVLRDPALKDVLIAKLDATANEYDRQKWEVSGYPTIYFKAAGSGAAVKYEGAREVKDMLEYIKKQGKTFKANKKAAKKAKAKKGGRKGKKSRRGEEAEE